ncbi:hypothetical protein Tco_0863744 [Tanacetum coccineum]
MNNVKDRTVADMHNMLKTAERGIEQKSKDVLVVASGNHGKRKGKWKGIGGKGKKKNSPKKVFSGFKPKKGYPSYKCGKKGHWSRTFPNCPAKKDNENSAKTPVKGKIEDCFIHGRSDLKMKIAED